mgnify:FL=1
MNHEMRLFPENFEKIKLGQKRREYRLYDEKRRKIMLGDTITFYNAESKESVTVLVENLYIYKNFKACYQDFWEEDFSNRGKTIEEVILDTYQNWWSKDKEEKYGYVVIEIKLI